MHFTRAAKKNRASCEQNAGSAKSKMHNAPAK
jgi:hypothetical protein